MIEIVKVVALKAVGDCSLWLRFSDGQEGVARFLGRPGARRSDGRTSPRSCDVPARVSFVWRSHVAEWARFRCDQSSYGIARGGRAEAGRGCVNSAFSASNGSRRKDGGQGVDGMAGLFEGRGPIINRSAIRFFSHAFVEMGAPTRPNGFHPHPIDVYVQLRDAGLFNSKRTRSTISPKIARGRFIIQSERTKSATASTASPSTCPGRRYSASALIPLPDIIRWFSSANRRRRTLSRSARPARNSSKSESVT